jgi:hypothetical protein
MAFTLALVDEGLLDITRFKTPDPHSSFYSKEALGVKTWDLYDDVIGAYGIDLERVLSIGGDKGELSKDGSKANRFKPMVKFFGPYNLKKGGLAPLGIYSSWSLLYTQVKGKILDKRTTFALSGPHAPLGLDLKTNIYTLGYSFGRTQVLADRFLIDYGANLNFDIPITFSALNGSVSSGEFGSTGDYVRDNNRSYDIDVSNKVFAHSLFLFHIGIGFLIN